MNNRQRSPPFGKARDGALPPESLPPGKYDRILAQPPKNGGIGPQIAAQAIDGPITATFEQSAPVVQELLIDVMVACLKRDFAAE